MVIYLIFSFDHTRIGGCEKADYISVVVDSSKMEHCVAILTASSSSSSSSAAAAAWLYSAFLEAGFRCNTRFHSVLKW